MFTNFYFYSLHFLLYSILTPLKKCPICLGILRETWTVMECMHRFCGDCIQKCLRGGKQECPSCRQHVPSKRSLRRDHKYDALILQVYSDVEKYERREDKRMVAKNRIQSRKISQDLQQKIEEQKKNQRLLKSQRIAANAAERQASRRSNNNSTSNGNSNNNNNNSSSSSSSSNSGDGHTNNRSRSKRDTSSNGKKRSRKKSTHTPVLDNSNARFQLKRDPNETELEELEHPWLCTSPQIQVRHLKKYLSRKINIDAHRIEITFFIGGTTQIMCDDKAKFAEIEALQQPKDVNEHCVLFFRVAR